MSNYQQWLDGEISDSELHHRQSLDQSQTLFDLGVIRERERIIKLQEHVHDETCPEADSSRAYQAGFEHAFALIKGENK